MNKFDMINDLLAETTKMVVKDEKSWLSFLDTSSYMFKYDFADQLLIYAQKPDAKACATFDYWNNRMKRWIKKGAKGIALIDDSKKYSSLRYVFDIADTRSPQHQNLKLWAINESMYDAVIESLSNSYGILKNKQDLGSAYLSLAHMFVKDNGDDYLEQIIKYNQNSSFENMEVFEIKKVFIKILENSIAYCLMRRSDIDPIFYFEKGDFDAISLFDTFDVIGVLGTANKDLTDVALSEIGRVVRKLIQSENRTFVQSKEISQNIDDGDNEGSVIYEGSHIQSSRGLSVSNLKIGNEENPLGKYAMLRMNYLKTNQPAHLFALRASNTLNKHLKEVEEQAQAKMEKMMEQMLVKHPAPNKETYQMEWVQHMNNLKVQVEEIILKEIIYN